MFITQVYKYESNGIVYVGGDVPEGSTILETMNILNAEEGFSLIRNTDHKNIGNSIWLHDGDSENNYVEIENVEVQKDQD